MKKIQLLTSLMLSIAAQTLVANTILVPCDKDICIHYLKVDPCHLAQCVFDVKNMHDAEKFYRMGCALLQTDPPTAKKWLIASAELNYTDAMVALAEGYERYGQMNEAWMWYERAGNNGHLASQLRLAERAQYGKGMRVDIPQAVYWYSAAGNQGYLPAQILLGNWYFEGTLFEKDFSQAAYWYELAALQGDTHSAFHYGAMLSSGNGVPYNEKNGVKWLTVAATQDHLEAQSLLGRILYKQRLLPDALYWLAKAAGHGDMFAMTTLGRMYRHGRGVPQDFRQAAHYFRMAAERGHTQAQALLGLCYNQGIGTPKNYQLAAKWYEQAAHKGNALAQFNLASLYYNGKGVEHDLIHAYAWTSLAADSGLHSAIEARRLYSNHMTVTQVERAQCLASQLVSQ